MNDRMTIAAMAMQGMLANNSIDILEPAEYAGDAVRYADALLAALAETALDELTETAQAAGEYDEVGDWRRYTDRAYKRHVRRLADGDLAAAKDSFIWDATPQGGNFWLRIDNNNASALSITRARDFARRVLAQMEADGE